MDRSDRAFLLELAVVAAGSLLIAAGSRHLVVMTVAVPALIAARFLLWRRLAAGPDDRLAGEAAFFVTLVAVGGLNDWNSVVGHRIYDYRVPVFRPDLTTIPFWMILYWGQILRLLTALVEWRRLGSLPARPRALWRSAGLLALVLLTRQAIYRWYLDPILSWLPFAAALAVYPILAGRSRRDLALAAFVLVGGPAIEVLYIRVAGLHAYHLGWIGGVPLWIVLWWVLGTLAWADIGPRLSAALRPAPLTLAGRATGEFEDAAGRGQGRVSSARPREVPPDR